MKKTISLLALTAMIAVGAVSCNNKGGEEIDETGTAMLSIEYGFKDVQFVDETRGATSLDAKPTTSWSGNVKSVTVILTNAAGNIVRVLNPDPPTGTGAGVESIASIPNLTTGTYKVYIIANAATATSAHGTAAINPSLALNQGALVGQNISSLTFNTVASSATLPAGIAAANQQPTEIFWGTKEVILSGATATATVELERSVSLMRVRINKDFPVEGTAINAGVIFNETGAGFVLRRTAGAGFKAVDGTVTGNAVDFYYPEAFSAAEPVSGYTGSMNLGTGNDFTLWNDFLILPGGAANVNDGFYIVIIGKAPAGGYKALNIDTSVETDVPAGGSIFWVAGVDKPIAKNGILELNVTLKSKGLTGDIPPPSTFGNIDISANLKDWGNVTYVEINI